MSLDNRANEHSCCVFRLFANVICIFTFKHFIRLFTGSICSFIYTYQIDYTFQPPILKFFFLFCSLRVVFVREKQIYAYKKNEQSVKQMQTTRNREIQKSNCCLFCTKSQSPYIFSGSVSCVLLFLFHSLFDSFLFGEITCKTHFIRMFLKVSSMVFFYLRNPI